MHTRGVALAAAAATRLSRTISTTWFHWKARARKMSPSVRVGSRRRATAKLATPYGSKLLTPSTCTARSASNPPSGQGSWARSSFMCGMCQRDNRNCHRAADHSCPVSRMPQVRLEHLEKHHCPDETDAQDEVDLEQVGGDEEQNQVGHDNNILSMENEIFK